MLVSQEKVSQSRSQERPVRIISDIQWYTGRRSLIIRGVTVTLTPTEHRLLFPLRHGVPVTYDELARITYDCTVDAKVRSMMDKHIDRIRGKLLGSGIYVYCVLGYGYVLLDEILPEEEA